MTIGSGRDLTPERARALAAESIGLVLRGVDVVLKAASRGSANRGKLAAMARRIRERSEDTPLSLSPSAQTFDAIGCTVLLAVVLEARRTISPKA